jgi:hypothetical protein
VPSSAAPGLGSSSSSSKEVICVTLHKDPFYDDWLQHVGRNVRGRRLLQPDQAERTRRRNSTSRQSIEG